MGRGLDPLEQNELDQLTHYINHGPAPLEKRILPMELKAALGVKTNVFRDLTQNELIIRKILISKSRPMKLKNWPIKLINPDLKSKLR